MIRIGEHQELTINRFADNGAYLTDGSQDVLLPRKYVPHGAEVGDRLRVFVYTDSEDRPVATTLQPVAAVGEIAPMRCVAVARAGAFMDWGLEKDLLVPHAEQRNAVREGRTYVVRVLLDARTERVIGTTNLGRFLEPGPGDLRPGDEVEALFNDHRDFGMVAVVDGRYSGTLFSDEVFEEIRIGDRRKVYVKRIDDQGRLSLSLSPQGYRGAMGQAPELLRMLERENGFLPYNDRTDPEDIRRVFGMSKASFKKLIGTLMRDGKITIEPHGIRLR